ncbi:MAG: Asp-tRNA(Asn)/Glu-tRNA(Gln) amidotransferase subunit GatB [Phycisphaerae bacterium]
MTAPECPTVPIIGLEIHVQLRTETKMFCGCPVRFEAPPNSCVCPVCLGHPGALPVVNEHAVTLGIRTGLALNCAIASFTKWDRKSYYYPDMPKNYQISQYDLPICGPGHFDIDVAGRVQRIRIRRAHLEEDAGKSIHAGPGGTLVDLNRAGTPLLEIVTEPDFHSAEEAYVFCVELHRLVVHLGVSEAVMKKGQMRFEPNVNVRICADGGDVATPIAEIKNLNSFKAVRRAIEFDVDRQIAAWRNDPGYVRSKAPNENRGYNDERGITEFQRPKEDAHDYRYFPDPDLLPLNISESRLVRIRADLPELPIAREKRLVQQYGLAPGDARTLLGDRATADLFEQVVGLGAPPLITAKQFVNIWAQLAHDRATSLAALPVSPQHLAALGVLVDSGAVNKTAANRIAEAVLDRDEPPDQLAVTLGLLQVQDADATQAWVDQALAANTDAIEDIRKHPKKIKAVTGFLRGQVMKQSGGKADPQLVDRLLQERISELL